jgi:hypothetical protein
MGIGSQLMEVAHAHASQQATAPVSGGWGGAVEGEGDGARRGWSAGGRPISPGPAWLDREWLWLGAGYLHWVRGATRHTLLACSEQVKSVTRAATCHLPPAAINNFQFDNRLSIAKTKTDARSRGVLCITMCMCMVLLFSLCLVALLVL